MCDWAPALFLHFAVDPEALQRNLPLPLDLFGERAFASVVWVGMSRVRISAGPIRLPLPGAGTRFLNIRTYVRSPAGPAVLFMKQYLSHPLAGPVGRLLQVPVARAKFAVRKQWAGLAGRVEADGRAFVFSTGALGPERPEPAPPASLAEFLLERYVGISPRGNELWAFGVEHESWPQMEVPVEREDLGLLAGNGEWFAGARFECAHFSPGVREVKLHRGKRVS